MQISTWPKKQKSTKYKYEKYLTKVGSEIKVSQVAKSNYGRCLVPNLLHSHHENWKLQKFFQTLKFSRWPNSPWDSEQASGLARTLEEDLHRR